MYQINFKKNEAEFIKDMKLRINNRKKLLNFYETVFLPTLKKFDGKILNARFVNSFKDFSKWQNNTRIFVTSSNYIYNEFIIEIMNYECNYNDTESFYFKVKCNRENRIIFSECQNFEHNSVWLQNFKNEITEMEKAAKAYKTFAKKAQKLAEEIEKYNDLNLYLRQNVEEGSKPHIF